MSTGYTVARDWVYCSLRLVEQVKICLQLVVQSLVVKCLRLDFPTTGFLSSLTFEMSSAVDIQLCLRLVEQVKIFLQPVVQSLVVKCLRLDFPTTASATFLDTQTVDSFYNSSNSFCNRYDDVTVDATSFFNRYDDVMVAESRFLSISKADVIVAARSFFQ
ncbi:hypothetical protein F511_29784 [Dorcoceras hygrometricum]|uniref:Uncharacterized protein n=1 Tax=Dorcoceras hygrometricum TaxID=472368 RepID=A0A2Z7CMU2_9LAMI|nr:hypothetical protein F511_29784 [Dorcoceras hygrometricum]